MKNLLKNPLKEDNMVISNYKRVQKLTFLFLFSYFVIFLSFIVVIGGDSTTTATETKEGGKIYRNDHKNSLFLGYH